MLLSKESVNDEMVRNFESPVLHPQQKTKNKNKKSSNSGASQTW